MASRRIKGEGARCLHRRLPCEPCQNCSASRTEGLNSQYKSELMIVSFIAEVRQVTLVPRVTVADATGVATTTVFGAGQPKRQKMLGRRFTTDPTIPGTLSADVACKALLRVEVSRDVAVVCVAPTSPRSSFIGRSDGTGAGIKDGVAAFNVGDRKSVV